MIKKLFKQTAGCWCKPDVVQTKLKSIFGAVEKNGYTVSGRAGRFVGELVNWHAPAARDLVEEKPTLSVFREFYSKGEKAFQRVDLCLI